MTTKIISAGSGGQGAILLGKLLAQAAMYDGRHVTYFPSYGAEVRGGTANCHVIISEDEIFSPTVETPDILVVMNQPSYDRFARILAPGGTMFIESSLVKPTGTDQKIIEVAAIQTADELGNLRTTNMVMVGAVNAAMTLTQPESMTRTLHDTMTGKKAAMLDINLKAIEEGGKLVAAEVSAGK